VKDGYCRPLTKGNLGYWAMLHVSLVCCCTRILISDIDNFICRCRILKPIQSMSSHMRSLSWRILLLAICRKALRISLQQLRNKCRWPPGTGSQLLFHFHLAASFLQHATIEQLSDWLKKGNCRPHDNLRERGHEAFG
jgi:hypothetical protein